VVGQCLYGLAMGMSNSHEMSYRQQVTPDELQARTNTTLRSINRAVIVVVAPLAGVLADAWGIRRCSCWRPRSSHSWRPGSARVRSAMRRLRYDRKPSAADDYCPSISTAGAGVGPRVRPQAS
jgi:hypothetical protein